MRDIGASIEAELTKQSERLGQERERLAYGAALFRELVPFLPRTLSKYFALDTLWTGYQYPPEQSHYSIRLQTNPEIPEERVSEAFGTVIKVAAALMRCGWVVEPTPRIEANQYAHALDVEIKGKRGETRLVVHFHHLPESERCKLVQEEVLVPAKYETKLRVVCDGAPVRLTSGGEALPEATTP